jgi:tRNA(Ile)-lysidine synthase
MTAHHALDQWETFFMRLSRGSSIKGLSCIKQISELRDIQLIRPLLDFTPLDTRETLEKKFGIKEYVNDPSNNSSKFERTKWRNAYQELSGKYNLSITNIDKAIKRIQSANDCLDKIAKYNASEIFDGTYIDITKFKELYHELKIRVLNIVIETISPKGKQIVSYSLLEKVTANICKKDFTATNLSGVVLRRDRTKNIKAYTENRKR